MNEPHMEDEGRHRSPIEARLAAPPPPHGGDAAENADRVASPRRPANDLIQSKAVVLAILFLATGFLGIPLLWVNRRFSNLERIAWSIAVTVYTCVLIASVIWIVSWSYRRAFPVAGP